jgi:general secretion pathway protein A
VQPPASLKALADPIYETFYGLSEQPFAITTDPRFFYLSSSHQRAFSELLNGLRRREGMLLLTGETGTGKTTLCKTVLESLGQRTFSAMILNPYMSGPEVFRIVLRDFGLVSHEELRRGAMANADVPQLLDTLEGFLRSLMSIDSHAVIVLDEAQSLAPQVLDQIRLLTALEKDNRRLVQIVLCGQPALLTTLKAESMHALNERVTRRVTLAPLAAEEVDAYIQHRLAIAGGTDAVSFDATATRVIADLSHGLPRRINVLCDRSLQEGRVEGVNVITPDLAKRAARSLAGVHEPPPDAPVAPPIATGGAADVSSLTLAQIEPKPGGARRATLAAIGAILMAAILGLGFWGYVIASRGWAVPPPPPGPTLPRGELAKPLPPLSLEEIDKLRGEAQPPVSGQLPGNPN